MDNLNIDDEINRIIMILDFMNDIKLNFHVTLGVVSSCTCIGIAQGVSVI